MGGQQAFIAPKGRTSDPVNPSQQLRRKQEQCQQVKQSAKQNRQNQRHGGIAVDNRSDDGSLALLQQASADLPITIFACSEPGKNKSLNFALDRIASSLDDNDLVIVTDDDILPDPGWLLQLAGAAAANPQVNVFGGTIRPVWPAIVPKWLPELKDAFVVLFATTSAPTGICTSHDIFGPNMAVRGKLFKGGLRFNPSIGPDGSKNFGMGSESELLRRIEREGHQFFFCEAAAVGHQIKPSLLRWSSVLARARRYGRGLGLLDGLQSSSLSLALGSLKRSAIIEAKALATLLPGLTNRRIRVLFRREIERGRITSLLAPSLNLSAVMRKVTLGSPQNIPIPDVISVPVASFSVRSTSAAKSREITETAES